MPGGDGDDADAVLGEVAGGGDGHAGDTGLGGGVGDLADLALVRGDGRRVDDEAAPALGVRLLLDHGGGGEPQDVEGADQVDVDDRAEQVQVVRAAAADDAGGRGDAGAVDGEPQRGAVGLDPGEGLLDGLLTGDVGGQQCDALGAGSGLLDGLVQVEAVDGGATGGEGGGGRRAEPGGGAGDQGGGSCDVHEG
ncbi:hypothetical protein GCM10020256_05110 [Streptomyces thermocoprophilus]